MSFLLQAMLLWQMASMARRGVEGLRPMMAAFAVGYVVFAAVAWRYFFVAPMVVELLIAGCLVGAFVAAGREVA